MKIIPRYRVLFRHSHGGTGCGSAHKPFLASRASFSSPSNTLPKTIHLHLYGAGRIPEFPRLAGAAQVFEERTHAVSSAYAWGRVQGVLGNFCSAIRRI